MDDFFDDLARDVAATEGSGKKPPRTRHDHGGGPPKWMVVVGLLVIAAILTAKFTGNLPD